MLRVKDKLREKKETGGRMKIGVKEVWLFIHYNRFGFLGRQNEKAPKGIVTSLWGLYIGNFKTTCLTIELILDRG